MNNAAAMRFSEAIANLARDFKSLRLSQLAMGLEVRGKRFAFEKLHGEEVHIALLGVSGMNFVDAANVGMAYS